MPAEMLAQENEHRGYEQRLGERDEHTDRAKSSFRGHSWSPDETDRVVVPLGRLTLQMSRAVRRHGANGRRVRRLHRAVSQRLGSVQGQG